MVAAESADGKVSYVDVAIIGAGPAGCMVSMATTVDRFLFHRF